VLPGIRSGARFAATGQVLFTRNSALMAQRFDAARLTLSGEPFQIAERAAGGATIPFSASTNGSVAYLAQPDTQTELQWFDRAGTLLGVAGPRDGYLNSELSPDDMRIAFDLRTNGNTDIWTFDNATSIRSRVTTDEAAEFTPVWSRDGRSIGFTSYRSGHGNLYRREVDVVGANDTLVLQSAMEQRLSDWSRDDRYLVYEQNNESPAHVDIWAISLGDRPEPIRVTNTRFENHNPRLSPDARWIAYQSNESGQFEVYVQSFLREGARARGSRCRLAAVSRLGGNPTARSCTT
jgi:eukaryotic-like serine/threonine-protein kinase